jgi:hypothetical protein
MYTCKWILIEFFFVKLLIYLCKYLILDIDRVYEWCIENRLVTDPAKILVYGQSVGSGPSCYLAATKPIGGIYVCICMCIFMPIYMIITT